ncbi:hypothetical protein [Sphaerisporangium aureirubrum]|uniref:Uncharacterized protein n=1 Tax=Sphaerisporangium aureirubrum TaxID=1544736 RepID=A0ABW1NNW3_9ACTN
MDAELVALASAAGSAFVGLMATDLWEQGKRVVVKLWKRARPGQAEAVAEEAESARAELLAARSAGDGRTEAELAAEWSGRMRRLVAGGALPVDGLREAAEALSRHLGDAERAVQVRVQASNHGEGTMNVLGQGTQINLGR